MSLTKKRIIFVLAFLSVLFLLGGLYFALSSIKRPAENPSLSQPIGIQGLIPGQSTKQNVLSLKGKQDITVASSDLELYKYETSVADYEDTYAFDGNILDYYLVYNLPPVSFDKFKKGAGEGLIYHELDDAYTWHVYPTKGIAVSTIGAKIVKTLIFTPRSQEEFDNSIVSDLGLNNEELGERIEFNFEPESAL